MFCCAGEPDRHHPSRLLIGFPPTAPVDMRLHLAPSLTETCWIQGEPDLSRLKEVLLTCLCQRILAPRVTGPDFISRYLRRSDFNLIKLLWPEPQEPISFDQVVYLNFSRMCRNVTMCLMPLALYLLIPTYGSGGDSVQTSATSTRLDTSSVGGFVESLNATSQVETASNFLKMYTINNTKSSALWMPVVYSYLATAIAHAWLVYYSRKIIGLKGLWINRKKGHAPFVRELLVSPIRPT